MIFLNIFIVSIISAVITKQVISAITKQIRPKSIHVFVYTHLTKHSYITGFSVPRGRCRNVDRLMETNGFENSKVAFNVRNLKRVDCVAYAAHGDERMRFAETHNRRGYAQRTHTQRGFEAGGCTALVPRTNPGWTFTRGVILQIWNNPRKWAAGLGLPLVERKAAEPTRWLIFDNLPTNKKLEVWTQYGLLFFFPCGGAGGYFSSFKNILRQREIWRKVRKSGKILRNHRPISHSCTTMLATLLLRVGVYRIISWINIYTWNNRPVVKV